MIDVGLLVTIVVVLAVPSVFVTPWPPESLPSGLFDASLGALGVGLVVGRVTAVALDDPGSVLRLNSLLVIRSGVEFWPGFAAGVMWLTFGARREHVKVADRLAVLAPAGLLSWALFEATCIIRDGCPGPITSIGIRPHGLASKMFPVGLVVAVAAGASAVLIDQFRRRGLRSAESVVLAVGLMAGIRSVASVWLPHVGHGLTRQHEASLVVAGAALATVAALRIRLRRRRVQLGTS